MEKIWIIIIENIRSIRKSGRRRKEAIKRTRRRKMPNKRKIRLKTHTKRRIAKIRKYMLELILNLTKFQFLRIKYKWIKFKAE